MQSSYSEPSTDPVSVEATIRRLCAHGVTQSPPPDPVSVGATIRRLCAHGV